MSRTATAVIGATITAAATGIAVLTAGTADASAHIHVQRFHAETTAHLSTSRTSFVLAEQDTRGSTVIGHDVLFCQATRTHSTCHLALAQRGGLLNARFRLRDSDHTLHGAITGGTGRYAHAHGSISGRMISASDVRVTLRYQV